MPTARFRGKDWSNEGTSVSVFLGTTPVSSANYDATAAAVAALEASLNGISLIPLHQQLVAIDEEVNDKSTDEHGQRESKARVKYTSTVTGKSYSIEVPGPVMVGRLIAGSDFFNLAQTQIAAFVTDFETTAREPGTNNAVTVDSIQAVGRTG